LSNLAKAAFIVLFTASLGFLAASVWLLYIDKALPSLLSLVIGFAFLSTSLSILRKLMGQD